MRRSKCVSRKGRSIACANIILDYGLFDEWKVFCYTHQKIKSKYRLANLFLLHKKMLYKYVEKMNWSLNCDNLDQLYFEGEV